jgi:RNA polymerase sigma factor (sigma-70 family)
MVDTQIRDDEFETHRAHLRGVAYRMLGSLDEADDAVQQAWLRAQRADLAAVTNLGGWLTTVTSRICLDALRSRRLRGERPLTHVADQAAAAQPHPHTVDPSAEAELAESVGLALLVVLDRLSPAERVAFVLHDLFAVPFEEIAPIVDRSPAAARQLASRARRRVQGASPEREADAARQREVVDAFLAASREGDFERLLSVLDPEVVLRADPAAVKASAGREAQGAPRLAPEIRGARAVAGALSGGAAGAQAALVDGSPGAAWAPGGRPRAAFGFTVRDGRIVEIEVVVDPETLRDMEVVVLDR